jgi:hypothetical protein
MIRFAALAIFFVSLQSNAGPCPAPGQFVFDERTDIAKLRIAAALAPTSGIKILWWNILKSELNDRLGNEGCRSLDQNLLSILQSPGAPDVMAFGEHILRALSPELRRALEAKYPHRLSLPYSTGNSEDEGVGFYSRIPIAEHFRAPLDWAPPGMSPEGQDCYRQGWLEHHQQGVHRFLRYYDRIKLVKDGKPIYIVPVHALQPWKIMNNTKSSFATVRDIITGDDNPLYYQLQRLVARVRSDFPPGSSSNVVMIGDFNTPKRMVLPSSGYRLLEKALPAAPTLGAFSFPAKSSPERSDLRFQYLPVQIDHAFVSPGLKTGPLRILPLQGSDHYPIMLNLYPN